MKTANAMNLINTHSHFLSPDAIVSVSPGQILDKNFKYSVGIHPWDLNKPYSIDLLDKDAESPYVIAIGETGLDRLTDIPVELQERMFLHHIDLSERLKKPLIIHCVRAHGQLMKIKRELKPVQPWIFHGFRLKPTIADNLIDAGFYISLGPRFNPDSARIIPDDRLLIETDNSDIDISMVAATVADARHSSTDNIISIASSNLRNIFQPLI